jgi:hypothetical protein
MNKQKLSLAAIQDKLSRNEMKQIMAGSMIEEIAGAEGETCIATGKPCGTKKCCGWCGPLFVCKD